MRVFTLGYQGLKLDLYTQTLLNVGVGVVLDVREVPWSNNRKYIKSVMQTALSEFGINYLHLKSCGNPSINRKTANSTEECLLRYRLYLDDNPECLIDLYEQIKQADENDAPACLTCYEKSPHDCHRTILLEYLQRTYNLEVVHLQGNETEDFTKISRMPLSSDTISQQL